MRAERLVEPWLSEVIYVCAEANRIKTDAVILSFILSPLSASLELINIFACKKFIYIILNSDYQLKDLLIWKKKKFYK